MKWNRFLVIEKRLKVWELSFVLKDLYFRLGKIYIDLFYVNLSFRFLSFILEFC